MLMGFVESRVLNRGGQKAEFGLRRGGLRMFFANAEPKSFFLGGAAEEVVFSLIFLAHSKLMIASIFLAKFHEDSLC